MADKFTIHFIIHIEYLDLTKSLYQDPEIVCDPDQELDQYPDQDSGELLNK